MARRIPTEREESPGRPESCRTQRRGQLRIEKKYVTHPGIMHVGIAR